MALDNNIDELQIEIGTESSEALSNLDALAAKLSKLDGVANKVKGLDKISASMSRLNTKAKALTSLFVSSRLFSAMGSWFKESNDYVEALNLFKVSMDDASDAALEYAQRVQDLMGIDIQDWLEAQGSFNQLLEGYGLAEDKAAQMSKQLTQLGYDLSSLWNVDVDTAMKRLQSGMSGQIKGLKAWGINLSVAQLRETALAHGIELSTAKMTEAQKATLRYITLMEKTTNVQGDLARTLITPANALRIFEQQVTQARRALGNIVSVVAVKVIPVFQAMVEIVTDAAKALASLMGYKLPEIDYSGISNGISAGADSASDMADGLSNAADAAKKLKSYTMGFDELNVIDPNSGSSGSTATPMGGGYASDFGFDPSKYEYDFLNGALKSSEELKEKLKVVLGIVGAIGAGIAAWKIGSSIVGAVTAVTELGKAIAATGVGQAILSKIAGAAAAIAIQFSAAGGGVSGFLSVLSLIAQAAAPVVAVLAVIISTLKVLVERWDDIKTAVADSFANLGISERLELLNEKLNTLAEKLGWVDGFWAGLKDTIGTLMDLIGGTVITILGGTLIGAINGVVNVVSGLISVVTGVVDIFRGLGEFLTGVFTGNLDLVKESFRTMAEGIGEIVEGLFTGIIEGIAGFVDGVIEGITNLGTILLGEIVPNIISGVVQFFTVDLVTGVNNALTMASNLLKTVGSKILTSVNEWIANVGTSFTQFKENISTTWSTLWDKVSQKWGEWKESFFKGWSDFKTTFKRGWAEFWAGIGNFFVNIWNGVVGAIEKGVNLLIDAVNYVISKMGAILALMGISIPQVGHVNLDRVPLIEVPAYELGGLPDYGELFLARESGPELVGQIGRQTAVVNNDQIVSGITNGVQEGNGDLLSALFTICDRVVRSIEENGGDVVIGDETIGRANDRYQQTRGPKVSSGAFADAY